MDESAALLKNPMSPAGSSGIQERDMLKEAPLVPAVIEHKEAFSEPLFMISFAEWATALSTKFSVFTCTGSELDTSHLLGYGSDVAEAANVIIVDKDYAEKLASPTRNAECQSFIYYFQNKVVVFIGCNQPDIERMSTYHKAPSLFLKKYVTISTPECRVEGFYNKEAFETLEPLKTIFSTTLSTGSPKTSGSPRRKALKALTDGSQGAAKTMHIEGTNTLITALLANDGEDSLSAKSDG